MPSDEEWVTLDLKVRRTHKISVYSLVLLPVKCFCVITSSRLVEDIPPLCPQTPPLQLFHNFSLCPAFHQLLNWKFLDFKHRVRTTTHIFTIKVRLRRHRKRVWGTPNISNRPIARMILKYSSMIAMHQQRQLFCVFSLFRTMDRRIHRST